MKCKIKILQQFYTSSDFKYFISIKCFTEINIYTQHFHIQISIYV